MARRFREARQLNNLKVTEAAERLGISQPTLSAWEGERKSPTLDNLEHMAELYGVTTDYLLGRTPDRNTDEKKPLSYETLPAFDGQPIWSSKHGWVLVRAAMRQLICCDGSSVDFSDNGELYTIPPLFAEPVTDEKRPLSRVDLSHQTEIWLEPISPDRDLRDELRGCYRIKDRYAENEYGNRFYLDTYGAKWLAFEIGI